MTLAPWRIGGGLGLGMARPWPVASSGTPTPTPPPSTVGQPIGLLLLLTKAS